MKRETIRMGLTWIALVPWTFFLLVSVSILLTKRSDVDPSEILLYLPLVFVVLGYAGLIMNLKRHKQIRTELVNLIFLTLGILGFLWFVTMLRAWQWILTLEEPNEWFLFVSPVLITLVLVAMKGKRLVSLYRQNADEQ